MKFSVYLCFSIIFCYYDYVRSAGGYIEGDQTDQNEDHNYNLGFQSRSGFQQVNSQTNPRQLYNQFPVQDTYDEYSTSNVENSGRPHEVTIFIKIPSNSKQLFPDQNEDHKYNLQSRSEFQQVNSQTNTGQLHNQFPVQDTYDQNEDHKYNLGFQSRSEFQQVNSQTNPKQLHNQFPLQDTYGLEQDTLNELREKTSGVPLQSTIPKESSYNNILQPPQAATTSNVLLRLFHGQFAHIQGENLPPAVIDKAAIDNYESRFAEDMESGLHLRAKREVVFSSRQDESRFAENIESRLYLPAKGEVVTSRQDKSRFAENIESGLYLPAKGEVVSSRQGDFYSALPPVQNSPPTPKWNFPLKMKAELQIPKSQCTETYQMWFNSRTGASKIDFHESGTLTYRIPTPDGRQVKVSKRINRLEESNIAECIVSSPQEADFTPQGLPDLTNYHFDGYENPEQGTFEKWVYELQGNPGQYGASIQESLTFHHEMVVKREARNVIPVKYSVTIDSSLLGANCDGYSHRYSDVEDLHEDDEYQFNFDIDANCQRIETADVTNPVHRIQLEPLHEFTLPGRDERYDAEFANFKAEHNRTYVDHIEEAMRKNLFIHTSRFITSLNRQSATFETGMNFLGERLEAEWALLRGVCLKDPDDGADDIEQFPHSEAEVRKLSKKLPKEFDWRPLGAVSHVRYQGRKCASCWAFSVAGAVEGALFLRKRRLVPLSEQCLVDCGETFGTRGCKGSWPPSAFKYVKAKGLPALDEYQYTGKKQTCKKPASDPITHISAYVNVTRNNVQALKIAIRRHAPTVVIVDAHPRSFQMYKRGVLLDNRCKETKSKHAVLAVGWGEHRRKPYFLLKNSWSPKWGEKGYIKVNGAANTCGVLNRPSYPRLEDSDVDRLPN